MLRSSIQEDLSEDYIRTARAKGVFERFKEMMSIHENDLNSEENSSDGAPSSLGDLEALKGVVKYPVRIKCATLGWNTFDQIISSVEN